jgi:AmiR/NasT family two-component response regulator
VHPTDDAPGEEAWIREAFAHRDLIGQAKGILMERFRLSADEAFDALRCCSMMTNRKLREVAEDLARTGEFEPRWLEADVVPPRTG